MCQTMLDKSYASLHASLAPKRAPTDGLHPPESTDPKTDVPATHSQVDQEPGLQVMPSDAFEVRD